MSESKEAALNALKDYLLKNANEDMEEGYSFYMDIYNEWKDATVDSLPEEYSIDLFEKDVVETYNG